MVAALFAVPVICQGTCVITGIPEAPASVELCELQGATTEVTFRLPRGAGYTLSLTCPDEPTQRSGEERVLVMSGECHIECGSLVSNTRFEKLNAWPFDPTARYRLAAVPGPPDSRSLLGRRELVRVRLRLDHGDLPRRTMVHLDYFEPPSFTTTEAQLRRQMGIVAFSR